MHQIAHVEAVLFIERQVEAVLPAHGLDLGMRGLWARDEARGVGRHRVRDEERDGGGSPQHEYRERQPAQDESQHRQHPPVDPSPPHGGGRLGHGTLGSLASGLRAQPGHQVHAVRGDSRHAPQDWSRSHGRERRRLSSTCRCRRCWWWTGPVVSASPTSTLTRKPRLREGARRAWQTGGHSLEGLGLSGTSATRQRQASG